jgi:UDP-glucuronate decarboxylase
MKTYLVTGGAGFLGSHLCERLLKGGDAVIAVDNLSSSTGANLVKLKYGYRNKRNRFKFYEYDICYGLNALLEDHEVDGVFNLACPASPPFYQNMPIQTTLSCTLGVHNVLEFATLRKVKVLQTSTSEVYGDPEVHPQPETYRGNVNCFGPRSCYDEGKRAAESLFYDYQKQNGTDIRVVRIFNTYGPHMLADDGRVVSNFITQALNGHDLTIYGTGKQTRSFCYVDDLLDALMTVWNSNYTSPVNIGNPGEFTMTELAEKVIHLTGSDSKITYLPLPTDDPTQRCPDITLAKSLGWDGPKIDLDRGLESTIQYFRYLKTLTG